MHPDLFYEALFSCRRNDLETLQLLSRTLRDMIVSRSHVLPLRLIYCVWMDFGGPPTNKLQISVGKCAIGLYDNPEPDYETSLHDGDFTEAFRRLQHSRVLIFWVRMRDNPFLRYWKSQETTDFTVMHILFRRSETTDYDVLDSVVNHLRPRITDVLVRDSKMLALLARDSFLSHTRTCRLIVNPGEAFPPPSFILEEPGFPSYELMCRAGRLEFPRNDSHIPDGIDRFIESFVRDGCTNQKLQSVVIQWDDRQDQPVPKRLSKPTKIDVPLPLPKMYMVGQIVRGVQRVTQCEAHAFTNAKHRQRMEVYKWTVEHEQDSRLHKIHLLECRMKSL